MAGRRISLMDVRELLRQLQATSNVSAIQRHWPQPAHHSALPRLGSVPGLTHGTAATP